VANFGFFLYIGANVAEAVWILWRSSNIMSIFYGGSHY